MKNFNLGDYNIEFKNVISGPAPVGRILNYIKLAGKNLLMHQNGYRYTDLKDNTGYAWTTELMIGLDLLSLGSQVGDKFILNLTEKGNTLNNLINHITTDFDEGSKYDNIMNVKKILENAAPSAVIEFEKIFRSSLPFEILKEYLNEYGYYYNNRKGFFDNYFSTIKSIYDTDSTPYNFEARTTTGENRVPSLIQICQLFDYVTDENRTLQFNKDLINKNDEDESNRTYSIEDLKAECLKEEIQLKDIKLLEAKYGIDGNVLQTSVVRNSTLQQMFKHNLLVSQNHCCIMCGIRNPELLIGSHIKPSASSNTLEKIDGNNGLLLCCNHDRLFDRYLITFDSFTGKIRFSKTLSQNDIISLYLDPDFILPKQLLTDERSKYLLEHNIVFEEKEAIRL
jgi:hypothetical protein